MTGAPRRIAIVGASAAGLAAATALRDRGFDGEISLIGAEKEPPYDRPPLSKKRFTAESGPNGIALADRATMSGLSLDLRLGTAAVALDAARRTLALAGGEVVRWDACLIATGALPVRLPSKGNTLRTLTDAIAIGRSLDAARHVTIIGGGVLGCELAALARSAGVAVTIVESAAGPMVGRVGRLVSARLKALHQERGVDFRLGALVTRIEGSDASGYRVGLAGNSVVETDRVLVAVGCRPATDWLAGSGVPLENGVYCDAYCEAVPGVFAAGDVASWYNPRYGRRMRIEHRMNATEQGIAAAANLLGAHTPFAPLPFFWTDQYNARIQVYGLIGGDCEATVLEDNPGPGNLMVAYSRDGIVEGILGWNMVRPLRKARALIGRPLDETGIRGERQFA